MRPPVAGVAELVDAPDLGSGAFGVGVRVPSPAPLNLHELLIHHCIATLRPFSCYKMQPAPGLEPGEWSSSTILQPIERKGQGDLARARRVVFSRPQQSGSQSNRNGILGITPCNCAPAVQKSFEINAMKIPSKGELPKRPQDTLLRHSP